MHLSLFTTYFPQYFGLPTQYFDKYTPVLKRVFIHLKQLSESEAWMTCHLKVRVNLRIVTSNLNNEG